MRCLSFAKVVIGSSGHVVASSLSKITKGEDSCVVRASDGGSSSLLEHEAAFITQCYPSSFIDLTSREDYQRPASAATNIYS